jgi:hypothetical protein
MIEEKESEDDKPKGLKGVGREFFKSLYIANGWGRGGGGSRKGKRN